MKEKRHPQWRSPIARAKKKDRVIASSFFYLEVGVAGVLEGEAVNSNLMSHGARSIRAPMVMRLREIIMSAKE